MCQVNSQMAYYRNSSIYRKHKHNKQGTNEKYTKIDNYEVVNKGLIITLN